MMRPKQDSLIGILGKRNLLMIKYAVPGQTEFCSGFVIYARSYRNTPTS